MGLSIPLIIIIIILSQSIIFFFFLIFWCLLIWIYGEFLMKKGVDPLSDEEFKELVEILNRKEVIEYIGELIFKREIDNTTYIAIEIDLKFDTSFAQKKGWDAGTVRDDRLYKRIVKLYSKIKHSS